MQVRHDLQSWATAVPGVSSTHGVSASTENYTININES